jgi:hypothetical protein
LWMGQLSRLGLAYWMLETGTESMREPAPASTV